MKLKFKIGKLEDVAEQFRSLYEQGSDGNYYLSVDGAVAKDKLDEFRDTNVQLRQQIEKFKDLDPELYKKLKEEHDKIQEGELIKKGDVEGLVNMRVQNMKSSYDQQIDKLTKDLDASNSQLEVLLVDNAVRASAVKAGIAPTAVDDVLLRAKTVFKVENGAPVAKDRDGNTIFGKDGQTSLQIGDWMGGLKESAPHLFGASTGGGSNGSGRQGMQNQQNLTPAQKIAAGMREQAGAGA